jgi:hypothetical protein
MIQQIITKYSISSFNVVVERIKSSSTKDNKETEGVYESFY